MLFHNVQEVLRGIVCLKVHKNESQRKKVLYKWMERVTVMFGLRLALDTRNQMTYVCMGPSHDSRAQHGASDAYGNLRSAVRVVNEGSLQYCINLTRTYYISRFTGEASTWLQLSVSSSYLLNFLCFLFFFGFMVPGHKVEGPA